MRGERRLMSARGSLIQTTEERAYFLCLRMGGSAAAMRAQQMPQNSQSQNIPHYHHPNPTVLVYHR